MKRKDAIIYLGVTLGYILVCAYGALYVDPVCLVFAMLAPIIGTLPFLLMIVLDDMKKEKQ